MPLVVRVGFHLFDCPLAEISLRGRDFVHRFEGGPDWLKQVRVDFVAHCEKNCIIGMRFKIVSCVLLIRRTCVARSDEHLPRIALRAAATVRELLQREKEPDMLRESPLVPQGIEP